MAVQPADTIRRMPARALDPIAAIVVADVKASLARLYGNRLRGVFVFGRGRAAMRTPNPTSTSS